MAVDWTALADELLEARAGSDPLARVASLGIEDPGALVTWITADSVQTIEAAPYATPADPRVKLLSMLCVQTQVGFEMGVAAVRRGLVSVDG
jgi:hypothetical protein